MTRIDHFNDPDAPRATRVVPAASAVVTDEQGRVLLGKRTDNTLWTIPGGTMKPGETIAETAIREVMEETGIDVEVVSFDRDLLEPESCRGVLRRRGAPAVLGLFQLPARRRRACNE